MLETALSGGHLSVRPAIRSFGHKMSTCWQIQPANVNVDIQLGLSLTSSVHTIGYDDTQSPSLLDMLMC